MRETVLEQYTLTDHWHRPIQITRTDKGFYRKRLSPGEPEESYPHGRLISEYQYICMCRIARSQSDLK